MFPFCAGGSGAGCNSLNRSMGSPDLYPFVLSPTVVTKLAFVHDVVHGWKQP